MYLPLGKLSVGFIDGAFASGGKGKFSDWLANQPDSELSFVISQNNLSSSHVTEFNDGSRYKFQQLPSATSKPEIKVVIGAGASIKEDVLIKEINDWKLTPDRLFIHPNAVVVTEANIRYEEEHLGYLGSTMTGGGASRAMKLLRHKDVVTADQLDSLKPFIANTNELVATWLKNGEAGLLETSQGIDLSQNVLYNDIKGNVKKHYPKCTSRDINPSSFMGESFISPHLIGNIFMNIRTFPIRVGDNSNSGEVIVKFSDGSEQSFCKGETVKVGSKGAYASLSISDPVKFKENIKKIASNGLPLYINGKEFRTFIELGSSGGAYPDQEEIDWETVTEISGSPEPICEQTELTKRIRRVFTFSKQQFRDNTMAIAPDYVSINFVNYLDYRITDVKGEWKIEELRNHYPKVAEFVDTVHNSQFWLGTDYEAEIKFLGTGAKRDSVITILY